MEIKWVKSHFLKKPVNDMKTKLLTICLLIFSSQVFAGWTEISKSSDGTIFYVDFDRTKEHNGYKYYYMLGDYLTPHKNVL